MQPPFSNGTILQNRYRLLNILGQGGFGRTYLAEDIGRFKEKCALKELFPQQTGTHNFQKSKELFQREASILYQIQHPQIPQFRATFEQDDRLFLVQDYVEGKTYRTLLSDRKSLGKRFSEAEILQLLQQLLPVLDYIHSKGIIHRDISPENIILRDRDRLPVLIDFGVVKELASRVQNPETSPSAIAVGKMGYAPSEQIRTGRAYPSSDLYALAVCIIVLLTGQEPQVLFDETTLSWTWQKWIPPVSFGLSQVLNRMLSNKPGDRYQDARAVARALSSPPAPTPTPKRPELPTKTSATPTPTLSGVQTIAVGNRVKAPTSYPSKPAVASIPAETSSWDNPFAIFALGVILAIVAGVGSWTLVSYVLNRQLLVPTLPLPTATPMLRMPTSAETPVFPNNSTPTATREATRTPSVNSKPVTYDKRLNLVVGETLATEDSLKSNVTVNYIVSGQQGQKLSALLTQEGVLMTVLGPNGEPVDNQAKRVTRWEGILPSNGEYTIELATVKGVAESDFKLELFLTNPKPTPTPTETPTETPTPTPTETPVENLLIDTEAIEFPNGATGTQTFTDRVSPQRIKRYSVNVQKGQVVSVRIQSGEATLDIRSPDGQLVENASGLGEWEGKVDKSGAYKIDVRANLDTIFSVDISVRK